MARTISTTINKYRTQGKLDWKHVPFKNLLNSENELSDFKTSELNFDLNHPVDILSQVSYDNSVNLILNDGKNPPKLINSRFTPLENNMYEIYDRSGLNDTNIYSNNLRDTLLQKTVTTIPKLEYLGDFSGGSLPVGNYHFYFKL